MSRLNDLHKEIQAKLLKVEFFNLVKDNLNKIESNKFKEVAKEVKDEINAFIDAQIDIIDSGEIRQEIELETLFTSEEVKTLKALASRAMGKTKKQTPKQPTKDTSADKELVDTPDKISFALAHRNLGGKRVEIKDKGNGVCVGLDAPYVVVKLDNGTTIEVLPQELII